MTELITKLFGTRTPNANQRYRDIVGKLASGSELTKAEALELEKLIAELGIDRATFENHVEAIREHAELTAFVARPIGAPVYKLSPDLEGLNASELEQQIETLSRKLGRLNEVRRAQGAGAGAAVMEQRRQHGDARRRMNELEDANTILFS